ncbi:hypothetical protein [Agriterribacter sp.]|uniref:hypothetical protein n=1 Tax=Agriterribacter sp. TaxID=2821509 RepID=UPI002D10C6CF|nr:hypothetical protein [Agriterribacter sp.]HTN08720.1 hypothetical protein [Agriterribacter sp.]
MKQSKATIWNAPLGVAAALLIFAALCAVYFVYLKWKVPETKGKTLEVLELLLTK